MLPIGFSPPFKSASPSSASWLQGFGLGAAPAVIGLLGITVFTLGRYALLGWFYGVIAGIALVVALFTKVSPILILIGGTALGALVGPLLTH